VPLRCVELHAGEFHLLVVGTEPVQACLTLAGVEAVVVGQLAGIGRGKTESLLDLRKPVLVERAEVCRLEDRMVDIAVDEQILHEAFTALVQIFLVGPQLRFRGQIPVVVVEAIDELLAVDIALVFRSRVPQGDVGVNDEIVFAVFAVHVLGLLPATAVVATPMRLGPFRGCLLAPGVSI
jgi:nitrogen regulatory protein PII